MITLIDISLLAPPFALAEIEEEDELQLVIGGGARPRLPLPSPIIHYPPIRRRLGRGFASVKPAGPKEEDNALALILILAASES